MQMQVNTHGNRITLKVSMIQKQELRSQENSNHIAYMLIIKANQVPQKKSVAV